MVVMSKRAKKPTFPTNRDSGGVKHFGLSKPIGRKLWSIAIKKPEKTGVRSKDAPAPGKIKIMIPVP